jgi:uncharacterized protein (DUF1684 family)
MSDTDDDLDAAGDDDFDPEAWAAELERQRSAKDDHLAEHPQSPIPPEERESFDGLDYFDPDPAYRVEARVTVHDDPETVELETTRGPNVEYQRVATFSFDLDGARELAVYSHEDGPLFVPFRDKTTGQQSYEQGRYMEFDPERDLETGDTFPLDFNLAYTPFCAFSETFACPLPPEENWLAVAIAAGERAP